MPIFDLGGVHPAVLESQPKIEDFLCYKHDRDPGISYSIMGYLINGDTEGLASSMIILPFLAFVAFVGHHLDLKMV